MASEIDKWKKRKAYPVQLLNGEIGYVGKMSFGQLRNQSKLGASDKTAFVLASCLCDSEGNLLIERKPEESLEQFVERAAVELEDLSSEFITPAMEAIAKITSPPDAETLQGN